MVVFIFSLSLLYGIEVDSRGTTSTTKKQVYPDALKMPL